MKLFYYKRPDGIENFGDSLNPWLWQKFIERELDLDETIAFVGIGTILNRALPRRVASSSQIVIFSSGVGYDFGHIPAIDSNWHIYCVRGALSAKCIGAPDNLGIADGAILLKRVFKCSEEKDYRFSFIPHVHHAIVDENFLTEFCQLAGINYIDPRWATETVLDAIGKTEILLAEAMHGAIAAEALRVPWIPIHTSSEILTFKWVDWCYSLGLEYNPIYLNVYGEKNQSEQPAKQLLNLVQNTPYNLSSDSKLESLVCQLEEKLEEFKKDVRANKFTGNL